MVFLVQFYCCSASLALKAVVCKTNISLKLETELHQSSVFISYSLIHDSLFVLLLWSDNIQHKQTNRREMCGSVLSSPGRQSVQELVCAQIKPRVPESHRWICRHLSVKSSTGEAAAQYRLSSGGVATITSLLPKSQKAVMWKAMLEKTTRYSKRANRV